MVSRAARLTGACIAPLQSTDIIRPGQPGRQRVIPFRFRVLFTMVMVLSGWSWTDSPAAAGGLSYLSVGGMAPRGSVFHRASARTSASVLPWGAPLRDGPRRCLLIAPRGGLGDAAMLRLHLGLEVTAIGIWSATSTGREPEPGTPEVPEWTPEHVTERLLAALRETWDVIILGNLSSRALPETVLSALFDRVAAGSGLLITHWHEEAGDPLRILLDTLENEPDETVRQVELEPVPGWTREHAAVRMYRHGKGRVVETAFPGLLPEHTALLPVPEDLSILDPGLENDLWRFACRLVLLAAGWTAPVAIVAIEDASPPGPASEEIPPDLPDAYVQSMYVPAAASELRPVRVRFDRPLPEPARLEVRIRVPDSEDYLLIRDAGMLDRGLQHFTVEIPAGTGMKIVDAWLKDRRDRTLSWASGAVRFAGWPDFAGEPELERTWVRANDTLNITVTLTPHADPSRTGVVAARCVDALGRAHGFAMTPVTAEGGRVMLSLPVAEATGGVLKIEITTREGDPGHFTEWDMGRGNRYVRYVSTRVADQPGSFELNAAENPSQADAGYTAKLRNLAAWGFSRLHAPAGEEQILQAGKAGLLFVPELARFPVVDTELQSDRASSPWNPEYVAETDQRLREGVATHWAGGCRMYSLGWGISWPAGGGTGSRDPRAREGFTAWLRDHFESVDSLNAAWGSRYSAWTDPAEQIQPDWTLPGNRAPWLAWQRFTAETFLGFMAERARTIRGTDRQGHVGFRVPREDLPSGGCWATDLSGVMDWLAVNLDLPDLARLADTRAATCRGYGVIPGDFPGWRQPETCRWSAWLCAGLGLNGLWGESLLPGVNTSSPSEAILPEGQPSPGLAALIETTETIRRRGALWFHALPVPPKVLVFDSLATHLFRRIDLDFPDPDETCLDNWAILLNRTGVDWAFVDTTRLDRLADPSVKVVILPHCRALTDGEIAAFQEFHARGGTLMADLLPGSYTEYGVRRQPNPLAEIFGARPAEGEGEAPAWVEVTPDTGNTRYGITRAERLTPDAGSRVGWNGNGTCCQILSADGRALLLNHPLRPVTPGKDQEPPPEHVAIQATLAAAGIQAEGLTPEENNSGGLVTRRRTLGTMPVYFALAGPADTARIKLPGVGKGYRLMDLLAEPSRPARGGSKVTLKAGEAGLWAVVPDEKPSVAIVGPAGTEGGKRCAVRIVVRAAGSRDNGSADRPVRIRLTDPTGQVPRWFRETVRMTREDVVSLDFYFAWNDPAGPWHLLAEDLLTGTVAEQVIQVTPATPAAKAGP